jgi:hypothetical protein
MAIPTLSIGKITEGGLIISKSKKERKRRKLVVPRIGKAQSLKSKPSL